MGMRRKHGMLRCRSGTGSAMLASAAGLSVERSAIARSRAWWAANWYRRRSSTMVREEATRTVDSC